MHLSSKRVEKKSFLRRNLPEPLVSACRMLAVPAIVVTASLYPEMLGLHTPRVTEREESSAAARSIGTLSIRRPMGENWTKFSEELADVLKEYDVTVAELAEYLVRESRHREAAVEKIRERFPTRKAEDVHYIVTSIFVSAYIHNLDIPLLLAIAENESRFKLTALGKKGERGLFQIHPTQASPTALMHPDRETRTTRLARFRGNLEHLGGKKFKEIARPIRWDRRTGQLDRREFADVLPRALYNAVWGARTLGMKAGYPRGGMGAEDWGNRTKVRRWLAAYNGAGWHAEAYAGRGLDLYRAYEIIARESPPAPPLRASLER